MGYESLFTPFKNRKHGSKKTVSVCLRWEQTQHLLTEEKTPRKSIISLKEQKEEPVSFIWDVKC